MELQGRVIAETEERSGTSARGEWKVKGYVIETHEQYPKKMLFEVFGVDRLARFNVQVGQEVLVSFDIDAHEYNGRWYNSFRAFDVRQVDPAPAPQAAPADAPFPAAPAPAAEGESTDDLPF